MFKKLKIQNFQSHKDTELEFHPGVNIIIGQSDSGKTAIFRALKWLLINKPSGDAFTSTFKEKKQKTTVILETEKNKVLHQKGYYELNGISFSASGIGVPEQIQQILKVQDLSLQSQMDPPFLLSETSGEVSRQLNEVADLSSIDIALSNINKKIRENDADLKNLKELKDKGLEELEKYENIENLEIILMSLKEVEKKKKELESQIEKEKSLVEELEIFNKTLEKIPDDSKFLEEWNNLEKQNQKIISIQNELEEEIEEFESFQSYSNSLREVSKELDEKQKQFKKEFPKVCPLCGR